MFQTPKLFEGKVHDYYQQFSRHCGKDLTKGVDINILPEFDINDFELNEDGKAIPRFKSMGRFKDIMYLNVFEKHLSYIKNVNDYCKKFQCPTCKKLFNSKRNCNPITCLDMTLSKYVFPGGYHQQFYSIFDELEEVGIHVPPADRFYNYFIVYNFESIRCRKIEKNWLAAAILQNPR